MTAATNTTLGEIKLAGDLLAGEASVPTLRPSGVKSGIYNVTDKIYVDAQGRVTWAKQLPATFEWPGASKTSSGVFQIGENLTVSNGTVIVNKASSSVTGIIKLGTGLVKNETTNATDINLVTGTTSLFGAVRPDNTSVEVDGNGEISIKGQYILDDAGAASSSNLGGVKIGSQISINDGTITPNYTLASGSTLGVIQAGNYFSVDSNGLLSAPVASGSIAGLISNDFNALYIDPSTGAIGCHWTNYTFYGHITGVSGSNIAIDDLTHTLSATYSFSDFSGDATTSVKGKVQVGDRIDVDGAGVISVPVASDSTFGVFSTTGRNFKVDGTGRLYWDTNYWPDIAGVYLGSVKPDNSTIIISDGGTATIAADHSAVPNASTTTKGYMQVGTNLSVSTGTISANTATDSSKGIIQVGTGLSVNNGVLNTSVADATTSSKGLVMTGTNISVDAGVISLPNSSYSTRGVVTSTNETNVKIVDGVMSFEMGAATPTQLGLIKPDNVSTAVNGDGVVSLLTTKATSTTLGTVKPNGNSTWVDESGALHHRLASYSVKGVIGAGRGINIDENGLMTFADASASESGILQPGTGLTVSSGILSVASANGLVKVNTNNVFDLGQVFEIANVIEPTGSVTNIALTNNINTISLPVTNLDDITFNVNDVPYFGPADFTNQSIFFVYEVIYKDGTSTPVQVKITTDDGTDSPFVGTGCVAGDLIVYEFQVLRFQTNYYGLFFKSATVFK